MFDLVNVFDTFLPQLLLYPNPTDPLNNEAATLLLRSPDQYKLKVMGTVAPVPRTSTHGRSPDARAPECVRKYAQVPEADDSGRQPTSADDDEDEDMYISDGSDSL